MLAFRYSHQYAADFAKTFISCMWLDNTKKPSQAIPLHLSFHCGTKFNIRTVHVHLSRGAYLFMNRAVRFIGMLQ